mmetsp:Transcript_15664/g.39806  ORF Transcript_15664/g.39806 Transcript_15664/m.39806 type:complete len:201 (+) Transcript_15664:182-784(+)
MHSLEVREPHQLEILILRHPALRIELRPLLLPRHPRDLRRGLGLPEQHQAVPVEPREGRGRGLDVGDQGGALVQAGLIPLVRVLDGDVGHHPVQPVPEVGVALGGGVGVDHNQGVLVGGDRSKRDLGLRRGLPHLHRHPRLRQLRLLPRLVGQVHLHEHLIVIDRGVLREQERDKPLGLQVLLQLVARSEQNSPAQRPHD